MLKQKWISIMFHLRYRISIVFCRLTFLVMRMKYICLCRSTGRNQLCERPWRDADSKRVYRRQTSRALHRHRAGTGTTIHG